MIEQDAFLEYARIHEKYYYGSPKSELERIFGLGKNVIYIIDVQ
jgi:guanylate kinase